MGRVQGRGERAIRGSLLGASAVILAAAAHAAGGDGVPGWLALVVALVAASLVGVFVVGHRPSAARTAIVVGVGQAGLHYLFAGLGGPGVRVVAGHVHDAGAVHLAGHAHPAAAVPAGVPMGVSMLAAHAVAAALTFALVWSAEASLWRMLHDAVRRLLALGIAPVEVADASSVEARGIRMPDPASVLIPFRRGPPAPSLV